MIKSERHINEFFVCPIIYTYKNIILLHNIFLKYGEF